MRFTINEAARATGGSFSIDPVSDQAEITSLTWDSRNVEPGALYVALPGERVDGHAFAAAAVAAGAICVLAQHALDQASTDEIAAAGAAVIQVSDTQAAVTALARAWRDRLEGRVIGITGSTGKTTTKNLVRDVLAAAGSVCATKGNQNNELGVPNTVLAARADTRSVVVEMGMRGLHQLEELCGFVRPQWGLVTNVGESHIELLGSRRQHRARQGRAPRGAARRRHGVRQRRKRHDARAARVRRPGFPRRHVRALRRHSRGRRAPRGPFRRRRGASGRVVRGRAP